MAAVVAAAWRPLRLAGNKAVAVVDRELGSNLGVASEPAGRQVGEPEQTAADPAPCLEPLIAVVAHCPLSPGTCRLRDAARLVFDV